VSKYPVNYKVHIITSKICLQNCLEASPTSTESQLASPLLKKEDRELSEGPSNDRPGLIQDGWLLLLLCSLSLRGVAKRELSAGDEGDVPRRELSEG
jgi:hypothetical protein